MNPKPERINNLIIISDTHCGCRLGLCPPEGIKLDDGGRYVPSKFQRKLWRMWRSFWDDWVPLVVRGDSFAVVFNGDALDGVHHGSVTQVSHNLSDQARIAEAVLGPITKLCEGRFFMLRGTEAHVGPSAQSEEQLAETLRAIPNDEGQYSRYDLWIEVGGGLAHICHHIGTTGVSHYETTAVHKELMEEFVQAAREGKRPPDFVIRSHRHRYIETRIETHVGRAISAVTPGWQGKTPFVWRVAGGRITTPQFGGLCIRQGDEELYLREKVWNIARTKTERVLI